MLFDWFTIAAQIINFLILLFLLRRFLYGPLVSAMNEREQRIEQRMREAEQRQAEADRLDAEYRSRMSDLDQQWRTMLDSAREDAERQRLEMLDRAREETDRLRTQWQAAITRGQQAFLGDLGQRTGVQIIEIARRALQDIAEADLEKQIIGVFLERLWQIPPDQQAELRQIQMQSVNPVLFQSAFPLPATQRQRVASVVDELLGKRLAIEFEVVPDLICGVSLIVGGREIAWSLQSYLAMLERQFVQTLADAAPQIAAEHALEPPAVQTSFARDDE